MIESRTAKTLYPYHVCGGVSERQRFYMTYARSRPTELVPWIEEHSVPLLTNAVHRWSTNTDRFLDMWEYDTPHVIDAGGYNVMASWVSQSGSVVAEYSDRDIINEVASETPFYPWTVDEYHEWLATHSDEFEWATVMDYACEDRFNELWDYEDRVDATFDNTVKQYSILQDSDADYKLLPVLQGRTVDEYVTFYERLERAGIPTDHVGVGTICRLSSEKRIVDLEQRIRERIGNTRLHGFGIKVNAFKHGATFDSADSQAWVYDASNGRVLLNTPDGLRRISHDNSKVRTVESFKHYYAYVTKLQQGTAAVDCMYRDDNCDKDVQKMLADKHP